MNDLSRERAVKFLRTWGLATATLVAGLGASLYTGNWRVFGLIAAAVLTIMTAQLVLRITRVVLPPAESKPDPPAKRSEPRRSRRRSIPKRDYDEDDPAYLGQQMLEQGRYALLLRPQIAGTLGKTQLQDAIQALDDSMGIVPEGDVLLQSWRDDRDADDPRGKQDRLVHVEAIYLDRYPVTNSQFKQFIDDGGYEHMPLWDAKIWPAVLDFVDRTGHCGPRFWSDGQFPEGLADHPVVGVSWYEASAYARWVGKRLPSDPEWVKAGCWPVLAQGTRPMQRRYPWGDTMDRDRAHLWGAGPNRTVSVYNLPDGVSVGGVYHLIGNVWEWTTSNFGVWDTTTRKLETPTPMKSIRGGAFDTYFETQATCQFQSGDSPISRKHNIGFRCALALCDVVSTAVEEFGQDEMEQQDDELEPVTCGAEKEEELV